MSRQPQGFRSSISANAQGQTPHMWSPDAARRIVQANAVWRHTT